MVIEILLGLRETQYEEPVEVDIGFIASEAKPLGLESFDPELTTEGLTTEGQSPSS